MCAGLVTDFGSVKTGISGQAWLALQDSQSTGLLDRVDFIETMDSRDREANILTLVKNGYDIVVTVGPGIADETTAAAQTHMDRYFIGVQQSYGVTPSPTNFETLVFHEDRGGFLTGAMAGMVTRTRHVAAVCEAQFIETIRRYCDGFRAGVAYVDPTVIVDSIYRSGSEQLLFRDMEWGQATAILVVDGGADVVFAVGGETAEAALKAAAGKGALVIGAETDQYATMPEIRPQLLTSAILDVRSGVLTLVQEALEGQFLGGEYFGNVGLAPFHELEGLIAPDTITRLADIAADLDAGAIDTGVPVSMP